VSGRRSIRYLLGSLVALRVSNPESFSAMKFDVCRSAGLGKVKLPRRLTVFPPPRHGLSCLDASNGKKGRHTAGEGRRRPLRSSGLLDFRILPRQECPPVSASHELRHQIEVHQTLLASRGQAAADARGYA
jgi:hypothetical protein